MAYYSEIEQILNLSCSYLMENQNICKLLSCYPEKVDFSYNPLSNPDIENPTKLLMDKIYPLPKTPDPETEQICFVTVGITGGNMSYNQGYRKNLLIFDIVCHLDVWLIRGGYRPFKIIKEIDQTFNNIPLDNFTINKLHPLPIKSVAYSDKFYGYQMAYEIITNSNIECG